MEMNDGSAEILFAFPWRTGGKYSGAGHVVARGGRPQSSAWNASCPLQNRWLVTIITL